MMLMKMMMSMIIPLIVYFDPTLKFPSGYFVEFADNAGDALTFVILTASMKNVLPRSIERQADDFTYRLFC